MSRPTVAALTFAVGLGIGLLLARELPERTSPPPAEATTDSADSENRLLLALQRRLAASLAPLDSVAIDSLLAPDMRAINAADQALDRSAAIDALRRLGNTLAHVEDDSIQVRRYGPVALLTLRETVTMRGPTGTRTGRLRMTEIWLKRDGRWRAVAGHATGLP